jgi:hypothetical protein
MAKVIWKYNIPIADDNFSIEIPKGAHILKVALQYGQPVMWVMVDNIAETEERKFFIAGTGEPLTNHDIANPETYIDTFLTMDDRFVLHLFDITGTG